MGKSDVTKSVFEISNLRSNCIFFGAVSLKMFSQLNNLDPEREFSEKLPDLTCPLRNFECSHQKKGDRRVE